jgi:hypothetical protein
MAMRRKMVLYNLVKNSIAAYFAAIEIHNKPNIPYRYETVTLLILNAWELMLKAFVRKFVKHHSIYEASNYTISFDKAVTYVNDFLNSKTPKSFLHIKENLLQIEKYRNNITHYYDEQLTPFIFMLVARCAVNYIEFLKQYFGKDIIDKEELFIMPIGFKLPFRPEDILSKKAPAYSSSEEVKKFIDGITKVITDLHGQGVEESIVLGFDIYLQSTKKITNSDLVVAITSVDEADTTFSRITNVQLTDDPNAQILNMSDDEFRNTWKYSYHKLVNLCKDNIPGFKQNSKFNRLMKDIKKDVKCAYKRKLDSRNPKSASQDFYTDFALESLKNRYTKEDNYHGI